MSTEGPRMPDAGDRFAEFELGALLGEGGMGRVFRAVGPDGELVALKILRVELAQDDGFRRRFEREASVAQRINHAHVVKTIAAGEHDGVLYLTQEFIAGGSLDDRLEREPVLPLDDAVRVCIEVGAGLDAMHGQGLVHRDIKPHNIMLSTDGRAYIADFGLAKDREASTVLTKLGQAMGSLDYMAPEQIRGAEIDARTDVYALGCVMFECLTGSAPFADRKGMQVMWAHLRDEPPDPTHDRTDLPDSVGWAMMKALSKEPEARPPTATAYARMLQMAAREKTG
ncbi:MAG: serine/threonine-protein kinase [Solirubrobacterales bacterium]